MTIILVILISLLLIDLNLNISFASQVESNYNKNLRIFVTGKEYKSSVVILYKEMWYCSYISNAYNPYIIIDMFLFSPPVCICVFYTNSVSELRLVLVQVLS